MRCVRVSGRVIGVVSALCASVLSSHAAEVTPERLLNAAAEPENWLMNLGAYDGSRYSGLSAINRENVDRLVVRYSVPLGGLLDGGGTYREALPLSPLVEDGFIYVVDGWGAVSKLDARRNGAVVWRNDAGQHNLDAWLQASRGIALYRNFVISGGADGRVHWIDMESGELRALRAGRRSDGGIFDRRSAAGRRRPHHRRRRRIGARRARQDRRARRADRRAAVAGRRGSGAGRARRRNLERSRRFLAIRRRDFLAERRLRSG